MPHSQPHWEFVSFKTRADGDSAFPERLVAVFVPHCLKHHLARASPWHSSFLAKEMTYILNDVQTRRRKYAIKQVVLRLLKL